MAAAFAFATIRAIGIASYDNYATEDVKPKLTRGNMMSVVVSASTAINQFRGHSTSIRIMVSSFARPVAPARLRRARVSQELECARLEACALSLRL